MFGDSKLTKEAATPEGFAKIMVERRDWIIEQLESVRLDGSKKEIRTWESHLKKHSKMVSDYELEEIAAKAR